MMKFFRKYTKVLLVIFMSLLLIVWLLGDVISYLGHGGLGEDKRVRGMVYGQQVTLADMQPAFNHAQIIEWLGLRWQWVPYRALEMVVGGDQNLMQMHAGRLRNEPLTHEEWFLLDTEARRSGVEVPDEAVARFKSEIRLEGERIAAVRDQHSVPLAQIDEALRTLLRMVEVVDLASKAIKPSEADIRDFVRRSQEKVKVQAVVINAASFLDPTYEPGEEEMQQHFEQWKDRDPSPGNTEEFGYRQPEKVQMEYIKIDVKALAARQEIPGDDDLYSYWQSHRDQFLKPATQPSDSPAATQPPPPQPYETFSEARTKVIEKVRDERSRAEALRLGREIIARLSRPWEAAPTTQPGGYREIPESEKAADLYDRIVAEFEPRYPGVLKVVRLGMLDDRGLVSQPDLYAVVALRNSRQPAYISQAAFYVAGLSARREDHPDHARLFRNLYETCIEPFTNGDGDVYIIRATAVQPKQPPASWQEVRDQLIADIRNLRAAEEARKQAEALRDRAAQVGLEEAFNADADLVARLKATAFKRPRPFARIRTLSFGGQTYVMPTSVPEVEAGGDFVDLCFEMASETATQPVRVRLYKQPGRSQWVVVQFEELLPVTEAEYASARAEAFNHILIDRRIAFLKNWFDPQQIRERVGWKDLLEPAEEKEAREPRPAAGV